MLRTGTLVLFASLFVFRVSSAEPLLAEHFDVDTKTTAETLATYPAFSRVGNGSLVVEQGVLRFTPAAGDDELILTQGFPGDLLIRAAIGGRSVTGPPGSWGAGLQLGGLRLIFHPGFAERIPGVRGAFRADCGQTCRTTADMGFIPREGLLHPWSVIVCGAETGNFYATVRKARLPRRTFHAWVTETGYRDASPIGLAAGGAGTGTAWFDDIVIEGDSPEVAEVCQRDASGVGP